MDRKRKHQHQLPPTKIAVLVDGGFFLKRFNALYNKDKSISLGLDVGTKEDFRKMMVEDI